MKFTINKANAKFISDSVRFDVLDRRLPMLENAHMKCLLDMADIQVINSYLIQEQSLAPFAALMAVISMLIAIISSTVIVLAGNMGIKIAKKVTGGETTAERINKISQQSEAQKAELQKYKVELSELKSRLASVKDNTNVAEFRNQLKSLVVKVVRKYRDAIALRYQATLAIKGKDEIISPGGFSKSSRILANISIVLLLFAMTKAGMTLAKIAVSLVKRVVNFLSTLYKKKESEVKGFVRSADSASKSILKKK